VFGVRLRVHRSGDGASLLLINGLGASLEMWSPLLAHLPQRDIIAFDLPGAGRSSVPRVPLRMRGIANIVAELMCKLGVGPADVLGCSFGGVVAQELAHRHPTMVNRLILAATSAGWPARPPSPLVVWLMMTPARYYDRRLAAAIVPVIAGGRTARDRAVLQASIDERVASPPTLRGYLQQLYAITGWTSQPCSEGSSSPHWCCTETGTRSFPSQMLAGWRAASPARQWPRSPVPATWCYSMNPTEPQPKSPDSSAQTSREVDGCASPNTA